jgi:hypothetical protein
MFNLGVILAGRVDIGCPSSFLFFSAGSLALFWKLIIQMWNIRADALKFFDFRANVKISA